MHKAIWRTSIGRKKGWRSSVERKTSIAYDALGRLASVVDENGHAIDFGWDRLGLSRRTTAAGQVTDYVRDDDGLVAEIVSSQGGRTDRTIRRAHDEFDRVTRVDYGGGETETFAYDRWGRLSAHARGSLVETYAYDHFGRLVEKGGNGTVTTYAYDAWGNRTSRTVRDADGVAAVERRSYDGYGRLVEIAALGTSVRYRYDARGRIARQTVDGTPIDFVYTKYGRLAGKYLGGRENPDAAVEYEYSPSGRVVARTANGVRQTYEYDRRGRLLSVREGDAVVERYAYDAAGNVVRKTVRGRTTDFAFDAANQLVSSTCGGATTRYVYDAAGRLVREGDRTYRYGYLDKVLAVTEGERKYTYDYHPDGQLARADYGGGRAEDFEWDGLALVRRGGERFVNEPHIGGGSPVVSSRGVTYLNDALGTTVGAKRDARYSAAALTAFGEGGGRHAFFTGKPLVEGLGRAFLMRNYRADLAKWQTADPLGYPDGWNPLAYCGNRVTMLIDVKGLSIFDFYFDDEQGKVIFNKWIEGGGEDYICWNDPFWSDYMRENQLLRRQVYDFLYADARGRFSGGVYDGSFNAEIENGYKTGYEMLHGTNQDKGDFQLSGIVSVEFLDGKRIVKYDVWEVWNDIIDPNPIYFLDRAYFKILSTLYNPKDYDIQLAWRREWTFVFE